MATATPDQSDVEATRERIREETPYWAESFGKIVNKDRELVPFKYKAGQLAFDRQLEQQRRDGKPMRMVVLKARQVGISTATQGKLIHRCTLRERYDAVVVAQDRKTGEKLYRMGERLYTNLPDDPELKPALGRHRRGLVLNFVGDGLWQQGEAFPDSSYFVDTAGEFQAGRGGTYSAIHASEVAFWDQIGVKLTALKNAVPKSPESLFVIESTANGYNEFKDIWDDAEAGRSAYIPFFWPWFKEEEYKSRFLNEAEEERFVVGDPNNPYAEEELDLVKHFDLSLEQLHWRRQVIADECNGDIRTFHQEYPSTPEEAFIATGQKVFDPYRVGQLMTRVEETDPRIPTEENPGPVLGDFKPAKLEPQINRSGETISVPTEALWVPRERGLVNPTSPFRLWLEEVDGILQRPSEYIVGVDVSGGNTETTDDTDYHAIEVIDHRTRLQVAEYKSRIEPEELTPLVLLTALFFNNAWVAVERTGSWGMPILRALFRDLHYPFVYRAKNVGKTSEKTEARLGWHTSPQSKPELVAGMAALLKEEEDGIRSRALADEVRTFARDDKGKTGAEPGKFDDLLSGYMIAQQVARERPLMNLEEEGPQERGFVVGAGGISSYDPRYR